MSRIKQFTCWKMTLFILLLFVVSNVVGQISPGDLTTAHADLEGMSNCTLCHDLGKKVSTTKCLDCHKDITSLQRIGTGYHSSEEVKSKDCFACHSEHHGRNFDMVRFEEKDFDHELAFYPLDGKHGEIDCKECHKPEYIADADIRKRIDTYLGLQQDCLSCHDDFHQGTLDSDCIKCHDFDVFRPAPYFEHDKTDYKLKGKHIQVDCIKCHKETTRKGEKYQEFTDIPFKDCIDCHDDPHDKHLTGTCTACHTVDGFDVFLAKKTFDHNTTHFKLRGSHKKVDCYECHKKTKDPKQIFQDQLGVKENDCIACHDDQHAGKFGTNCAKCHNVNSFLELNDMSFFEHDKTDFPLKGKHVDVDCKKCHENNYSDPIDFSSCKNCHEDYHKGEFRSNNQNPDCIECHSLNEGFDYSLYSLEQHQTSQFPLDGAHEATPCFACHVSEDDPTKRWHFRNIGEDCVDCHDDIHSNYIQSKYYPKQDCKTCHGNDTWNTIKDFDHDQTDWALEGKHKDVDCRECHINKEKNLNQYSQQFKDLGQDCITCHDNPHDDQFAENGVTDCIKCHDSESWVPTKFDHSKTNFPLDGKHKDVDCKECHKSIEENGKTIIQYKLEKYECIDCHG